MDRDDRILLICEALGYYGLVEDWLLEAIGSISIPLTSLETDKKFQDAPPQDVQITDFKLARPGESISASKDIYLPDFAFKDEDEYKAVLAHIKYAIDEKGSVSLTTLPGFSVGDGTLPSAAAVVQHLSAEQRTFASQQEGGGIVIALDGVPLSKLLEKPVPVTLADVLGTMGKGGKKDDGSGPAWLTTLSAAIDERLKGKKVDFNTLSRTPGFIGDLVISTREGDSVLIVSKGAARAAYVMKKKYTYPDGSTTDWDVALNTLMSEFATKFRRESRPRRTSKENIPAPNLETVRYPKLRLRDNLKETGNGYALRRDYHVDDIVDIVDDGVNYASARKHAEETVPAVESFVRKLDAVFGLIS